MRMLARPRLRPVNRDKPAVSRPIDFHLCGTVRGVHQATVRSTAMLEVEGYRREPRAVVLFPLIDAAISIGIFLDPNQRVLLVVLEPVRFSVPLCRQLDPYHSTGSVEV